MTTTSRHRLVCIFSPEILAWEKEGVTPILTELGKRHDVHRVELLDLSYTHVPEADAYWIIARDWRSVLSSVSNLSGGHRKIVSLFGLQPESGPLITLLWRKLFPQRHLDVSFLAHTPLNFRFMVEIDRIGSERIQYLPLAYPEHFSPNPIQNETQAGAVVGTLAHFTSESNLNYFLTVAHYVRHRRQDVRFRILGTGPLFYHLSEISSDLELSQAVSLVETLDARELAGLDLFLYFPLRNDHFQPLLLSASLGIPALCSEVPGIEAYIQDGKSGFIIGTHEIKPMGELILRCLAEERFRASVGAELNRKSLQNFRAGTIVDQYEQCFFGAPETSTIKKAA